MFGNVLTSPETRRRQAMFAAVVAVICFILDQISKWWILEVKLPCLSGPAGPALCLPLCALLRAHTCSLAACLA